MDLSAGRITNVYAPLVLNGLFGILNNWFSDLWNPVLECISVLVSMHFSHVWDNLIDYLDRCQAIRETSSNLHDSANDASFDQPAGMFQLLWHHILSSSFLLPIFLCTRCLRWETWTLMYIVYCSLVGFSDLGLIYYV
jgi:U3 small nucleolar RNA-associated protein 20